MRFTYIYIHMITGIVRYSKYVITGLYLATPQILSGMTKVYSADSRWLGGENRLIICYYIPCIL